MRDLTFNLRPFATITSKILLHYIELLSTLSGELKISFFETSEKQPYWLDNDGNDDNADDDDDDVDGKYSKCALVHGLSPSQNTCSEL